MMDSMVKEPLLPWVEKDREPADQPSQQSSSQCLRSSPKSQNSGRTLLMLALVASVALNAFLLWPEKAYQDGTVRPAEPIDAAWPLDVKIDYDSPYVTADNESDVTAMWESIDIAEGVIALDQETMIKNGFPKSQTFPWDTTKGVYVPNAYHQLHCAQNLYRAIFQWHHGLDFDGKYSHLVHCLDTIRQDAICKADDTPLYTTFKEAHPVGYGQVRRCRDWDALQKWVKDNSACYTYDLKWPEDDKGEFSDCPEDSPYAEKARQYFTQKEKDSP